jgi:acetyl-CoA acetyltransferase
MTDVVIASAARTAIGSHGRGLASVPPSDLGAIAASAALERAEMPGVRWGALMGETELVNPVMGALTGRDVSGAR